MKTEFEKYWYDAYEDGLCPWPGEPHSPEEYMAEVVWYERCDGYHLLRRVGAEAWAEAIERAVRAVIEDGHPELAAKISAELEVPDRWFTDPKPVHAEPGPGWSWEEATFR